MFSYNQYTTSLVKYKTDDNATDVELIYRCAWQMYDWKQTTIRQCMVQSKLHDGVSNKPERTLQLNLCVL